MATFFGQLRSLCSDIDSQLSAIKEDLRHPPGSFPHRYDGGLNKVRADFQDLKKLSSEVQEGVGELMRFGNYLKDARELVAEQEAGIHKMEMYCAQYGYVIPEIEVDTPLKAKTTAKDTKESVAKDSDGGGGGGLLVTPELTVCIRPVQGKRPPVPTSGRKPNTASPSHNPEATPACKTPSRIPVVINTPRTPQTPKIPKTPKTPKPYMMMEQWMTGTVEDIPATHTTPATTLATPNIEVDSNTPWEMETDTTQTPTCDAEANTNSAPHSITTPEEPVLSSLTMQLLSKRCDGAAKCAPLITTPEEPILHTQHIIKNSYEENRMPEEPVLHYTTHIEEAAQRNTPEEPVLHYNSRMEEAAQDTPEEPVLSYQPNMSYTWKPSGAMKEPVTSYHPLTPTEKPYLRRAMSARVFTPHTEVKGEDPQTPELSDVTRSFMSLLAQRKEYDQPETHREVKMSTQPISELKGMSCPQVHQGMFLNRSIIGASQLRGTSQPHHQDSLPTMPHKPKHSFSEAMNKLNSTWGDENDWRSRETQHSRAAGGWDRLLGDKGQAVEDSCLVDDVPPSPQLSDITQRIIGQLRR